MKASFTLLSLIFFSAFSVRSQEKPELSNDSLYKTLMGVKNDADQLKKLKITGWVQAQYQVADTLGVKNYDGGDFPSNVDSRFMIRRGRVKFTYTNKLVQYVLQLNATERMVNLTEIYGKVTDPWTKWFSLQAGVMNRPFGYDIQLSSQHRESPERARYTQMLTPNERDMGAEIIAEAPSNSKFKGFSFTAGFFNGTGLTIPAVNISDIDSKKDFIGRVAYYKSLHEEKFKYGAGFSHYNGFERVANNVFYNSVITNPAGDPVFMAADTTNKSYKGTYAKRVYYGVEGFLSVKTILGTTTLRGEYIWGTQPGTASDSKSPQAPTTGDTYLRNFQGAYVFLIQRFGKSKHELLAKLEGYDPNTKVSGNKIDPSKKFNSGDIMYTAVGLGYNFLLNDNCKFMFYYNMVTNEKSNKLVGYSRDLPDNIFTARLQVRF